MTTNFDARAGLQDLRQQIADGRSSGVGARAAELLVGLRAEANSPELDRRGFDLVRACRRFEEAHALPADLRSEAALRSVQEKALQAVDALLEAAEQPEAPNQP